MTERVVVDVAAAPQSRPSVATLFAPLRVRLPLLVALVITIVVGTAGLLEQRVFESSITNDLVETARSTAQAVADDIEIGEDPLKREGLAESLREFTYAVPAIRAISVVTIDQGEPVVVASTYSSERPEAITLARRVIERQEIVSIEPSLQFHVVGVPARRDDRVWGAVVLTYSLGSVEALRRQERTVVFWFVPGAIGVMTLLLDLLARRMIHKPIAGIRKAMQRVQAGDLGARAPVVREDEIGVVAQGLNDMLGQMEGFHAALQERVREATRELRAKNEQLVGSYQRLFAPPG